MRSTIEGMHSVHERLQKKYPYSINASPTYGAPYSNMYAARDGCRDTHHPKGTTNNKTGINNIVYVVIISLIISIIYLLLYLSNGFNNMYGFPLLMIVLSYKF